MFTTRAAFRSTRAVRANGPAVRRNVRFQSNNASGGGSMGGMSPHVTSGLVGAGAATAAFYLWYRLSGLSTAVNTAQQAKSYIDSTTGKLKASFKEATPDNPNEVIQALKETATNYAKWIPGGRQYVDTAFDDLEKVRQQHGSEVDNVVREAYSEIRDASKKGVNMDMLSDVWNILQKHLGRLSSLAADAGQAILDNHPDMKQQFGGKFNQLKQLGDQAGPQAQKMVNETWQQVSEIMGQGFKPDTVDKIRKLIEEKTEQVQQMGGQAWQKAYDSQIKPMLDRNPQVKKMVEENQDILKQGSVSEAMSKIQSAVSSGSTQDLQQYVQQAKDKAQQSSSSSSGGLSGWMSMIPSGSQILPQLQRYKEVAEKHGDEAQKLAKETFNEITQILEKRSNELEDLAKSAKREGDSKK